MSIRDQAASDLRFVLSDAAGFSQSVFLTSPDGVVSEVPAVVTDASESADVFTGQRVTGRWVRVRIAGSDLRENVSEAISGQRDGTKKPWLVEYADASGAQHRMAVIDAFPDRSLDFVVLELGGYG